MRSSLVFESISGKYSVVTCACCDVLVKLVSVCCVDPSNCPTAYVRGHEYGRKSTGFLVGERWDPSQPEILATPEQTDSQIPDSQTFEMRNDWNEVTPVMHPDWAWNKMDSELSASEQDQDITFEIVDEDC